MKQFKTIAFLLALWLIVVYFMFAFTTWELNPSEWSENGRFFFCMIMLFGGFCVVGATVNVMEKN